MNFFTALKQGQIYLNTWPLIPKLGMIFPENRVIKATKFAQKLMPFLAVFALVWQQIYAKGEIMAFAAAILTALFALCLPLQGLYWLGKRASSPLPAKSAVQFSVIFSQLEKAGCVLAKVDQQTYQDLAQLLHKAQKHLPADFWQSL
ncbi:terminus macrodomain insulation protein YfbV [Avibacterium paragallinarum]|uniref:terminus macrodomain insulation protein YfbV n=1 Tax=Avibacterium paragallinarum TaxID=728 RepID=UPI00397E2697